MVIAVVHCAATEWPSSSGLAVMLFACCCGQMIAEINAVVDELLAVPGIGSHTQSSEKLRDRANNVASQLQVE